MVHFVLSRTLYLVGVEKLRDLIIAGNEIFGEHGMSSCGVLRYLSELSTLVNTVSSGVEGEKKLRFFWYFP